MIRYKTYVVKKYMCEIDKDEALKELVTAICYRKFPNFMLLSKLENYLKWLKVSDDAFKAFYKTYISYLKDAGKHHFYEEEIRLITESINKKLEVTSNE